MARRSLIPKRWPGRWSRRGEAGIAIPTAILAVLVIIIGSLLLTARSLSTWVRSTGLSDQLAAKDAAEYGFTKLLSQLNSDSKAYLLVSKYDSWNTITQSDLDSCDINTTTSPAGAPLSGVDNNSSSKTVTLPNSPSQSYSLTNYSPPQQPPGASNSGPGKPCGDNSTSAAKFGNLLGGSSTLEVTGSVKRNGRVAAKYVLRRSVHVKWPNQAISNPIALLGTGSQLNTLNGRICQTSANPVPTNCNNLPLTTMTCADLEDCLYYNVDLVSGKKRKNYCNSVYNSKKKYKKNIICNEYQQLGSLPPFPTLATFNDTRPTSTTKPLNTSAVYSIDLKCDKDISKCAVTPYSWTSDAKKSPSIFLSAGKATSQSFADFPYLLSTGGDDDDGDAALSTITSKAKLPTKLNSGCYYNSNSPATATAINCIINYLDTGEVDLEVNKTTLMPVNLFIQGVDKYKSDGKLDVPAIDVDKGGGIFNADTSSSGWQNLRIFGYSRTLNSINYTSSSANICTDQTVFLDKAKKRSKGGIIDGAFLWFPNATFKYNALNTAGPFLAMWVCKLTGPTKGTDVIVTPLSRRGINAGISSSLNGFGGSLGLDIYRAFGSKGTASEDN